MGTLRYLLLPSQQVQSVTCSQCQRMVQVMGSQSRLNSVSPDFRCKPAQCRPVAYLLSHARQTQTHRFKPNPRSISARARGTLERLDVLPRWSVGAR